jgi:hypothetical protein
VTIRPKSPLLAAFLLVLHPSPSQADEGTPPPRVSVALTGCDPSLTAEVQRIAAVELRAVIVSDTDPQAPLARATVKCHDEVADLSVSDAATGKVVSRSISLASASPGRLLALAVAELVAASWEEIKSQPPPRVPPLVPAPEEARAAVLHVLEQRRQGSEQDMPIVTVEVAANARGFFDTRTVLFGGEVRAGIRLVPEVFLLVAAGAGAGTVRRSSGDVDVSSVDGSLGVGWARESLRVWAGGVGGYARIQGQGQGRFHGAVVSGPWAGPELGADVVLWPHALLHATLGAALGVTLQGVEGDVQGDSNVAVQGAWASLRLGIGVFKP